MEYSNILNKIEQLKTEHKMDKLKISNIETKYGDCDVFYNFVCTTLNLTYEEMKISVFNMKNNDTSANHTEMYFNNNVIIDFYEHNFMSSDEKIIKESEHLLKTHTIEEIKIFIEDLGNFFYDNDFMNNEEESINVPKILNNVENLKIKYKLDDLEFKKIDACYGLKEYEKAENENLIELHIKCCGIKMIIYTRLRRNIKQYFFVNIVFDEVVIGDICSEHSFGPPNEIIDPFIKTLGMNEETFDMFYEDLINICLHDK